ncbi:MAG: hypothetical protein Q9163_001570 [Psora crenata]
MSSSRSSSAISSKTSPSRSPSPIQPILNNGRTDSQRTSTDGAPILPNPSSLGRSSHSKRTRIDRQSIEDIEHPLQAQNISSRRKRMGREMLRFLSDGLKEPPSRHGSFNSYSCNSPVERAPNTTRGPQSQPTRNQTKSVVDGSVRSASAQIDIQRAGHADLDPSDTVHSGDQQSSRDSGRRLPSVHTILADSTQKRTPPRD